MYAIYELPRLLPEPSPPAVSARLPRCADGNGTLTPLFFSDDVVDIARAKAICAQVPARGVLSERRPRARGAVGRLGRRAAARTAASSRTSGRAAVRPSIPRPELVVDELGVVGSVA